MYDDGSHTSNAVKLAKEADYTIVTRGGVQGHEAMVRACVRARVSLRAVLCWKLPPLIASVRQQFLCFALYTVEDGQW